MNKVSLKQKLIDLLEDNLSADAEDIIHFSIEGWEVKPLLEEIKGEKSSDQV